MVEQSTSVEQGNSFDAGKTTVFAGTRIYELQETEPAGLLGWLVVTDGPEKDRDFRVMAPRTTIGRAADCDIILDNPHVSTKHTSLRLLNQVLYITDLDSSNGTYVNSKEITKAELKDNDTVTIGDISLRFRAY
jgi:pSer/pThr/pTyr-binding forkhead associated (FHA) protein